MTVKLIDFGSARPLPLGPSEYFVGVSGTLAYTAPEVLRGDKYRGPEADVYALGVLLFVLLVCLEFLFRGKS
jgi:serine/threonine protein kinase